MTVYVGEHHLVSRREVALETVGPRQTQLHNDGVAAHEKTGESHSPKIKIPLGQPADVCLEMLRHVVVMVALVPEGSQQI